MIGSSENTIKEITKKITVEQIINRNTRRLQPNQKDFKQNNSSHMTFIYMFRPNMEFAQSWNFFHQLYNYSKKIL